MTDSHEMPKYKCHKEVHALKIDFIGFQDDGVEFTFKDEGFEPLVIKYPEAARFKQAIQTHIETNDNGYLVVYEDGYRSWSPTKAFEEGYTRL